MRNTVVYILALVVVSLWMHTPTIGQGIVVPIYVTDGTDTITLHLGILASATFGSDPLLGEASLPPAGVSGVFDARLVSPRGDTAGFDQGRLVDIRTFIANCQLDTFKISFQPGSGTIITFFWDPLPDICVPTRWRLTSDLSGTPEIDVDMTTTRSVHINYNEESHFVFICKGDGHLYRTFTMPTLALDGLTDAKGKKSYGKEVKAKNNQVQFSAIFVNTTGASVNDLHIEWKFPIDSSSLEVSDFPTWGLVKARKYDKWNFSGATIAAGETVWVSGYGIGTKSQSCSWYWTNSGTMVGTKQKTGTFTSNTLRLPMPNTINAGLEMFAQAFPNKGTLVLGSGPVNVIHKKYGDILKSLVANPGKAGKQVLHDTLPTRINVFDAKIGFRMGKTIVKAQNTLPPNKHRNKLFGEALALDVNLYFSQTLKVPIGLGALKINVPGSPLHDLTLSQLVSQAGEFLSTGTVVANPTVTATQLADMCKRVNEAFSGALDTISWGGTKVVFTGARAIGDLGTFLIRPPSATPQSYADLTSNNSDAPLAYSLSQNYPNPFNPSTTLSFVIGNSSLVTLKVYDILGKEVATLLNNENVEGGIHEVTFNANDYASGVYFYRITAQSVDENGMQSTFTDVKRMVLIK